MSIKCKLDDTCKLELRKIPNINKNTVTAIEMNSRVDKIQEHLPEILKPSFGIISEELEDCATKLNEVAPPDMEEKAIKPTPITEEMKAKFQKVDLEDHRQVNWTLDDYIRDTRQMLLFKEKMHSETPKGTAATLLLERWYQKGNKKGIKFLTKSGPIQWLGSKKRFSELKEDEIEAIRILGMEEEIEKIAILNDHYGKLLNIIEAQVNAPGELALAKQQKQEIKRFHKVLTKLVAFANLAWPDSTKVDEDRRMIILGPYIERLLQNSKERSEKIKKTKKKKRELEENKDKNSAPEAQ